jgi:hypothetical protein
VVVALLAGGYLYFVARAEGDLPGEGRVWLTLGGAGLAVFALGYAIFLTNQQILFTSTGISNRINIAAATGVAMLFVAVFGWVATRRGQVGARRAVFGLLVALVCLCGFVINNTLARYWIEAYRREEEILAAIEARLPALQRGTTLILDGVCPYIGPAVVFESNWDLAGALGVRYREPGLRAAVVTPNMVLEEDALSTLLYENLYARYPYGENLLLFDYRTGQVHRLRDYEAARRQIEWDDPERTNGCPRGEEGFGVSLLPWR